MSNRCGFPRGTRVLEKQLESLIFGRTQLTNNVAGQVFPGEFMADAALGGLDADDVVQMFAAKLVRSLKDAFDLRRNRLFAPRPERENHRKSGQRGPLGAQVEHITAQRSGIE